MMHGMRCRVLVLRDPQIVEVASAPSGKGRTWTGVDETGAHVRITASDTAKDGVIAFDIETLDLGAELSGEDK
jgi:hypothetical protein